MGEMVRSSFFACVAGTVVMVASASCAVAPPIAPRAIPGVASIPVAPMEERAAHPAPLAAPVENRSATPAILGVAPRVTLPENAPDPSAGASAASPAGGNATAPRVVLVDELPYRPSRGSEQLHKQAKARRHRDRPYELEPGVVIDVARSQGAEDAADRDRIARSSAYWPFRRCYEEGLRRDPSLAGRASLDLAVGAGGEVERANVVSATLRDESVLLCIAREAKHLALAPAASPSRAALDVSLSPGARPRSGPLTIAHAGELREALRASWPGVERCYASGLAMHPGTGGRIELRFRANRSGEVVDVTEQGDARFADLDVARCVVGVFRVARLPASRMRSGRETTFVYAMHVEAASPSPSNPAEQVAGADAAPWLPTRASDGRRQEWIASTPRDPAAHRPSAGGP